MSAQTVVPATTPAVTLRPAPLVTGTPISAECTECSGAIRANVALPGEILACPDCGAELEVRSLNPVVLALAPEVEEDWGE